MKDFEGKTIKIYFNQTEGWVCLKADYIRFSEGFFVVRESISRKIRYINKDYVRSVEIIGDINAE